LTKLKGVIVGLLIGLFAAPTMGAQNFYHDSLVTPAGDDFAPELKFADLRFTNRAQCALDSEKPTASTFLIFDSYNAGKVANSIAAINGQDKTAAVTSALIAFRLRLAKLSLDVVDGIKSGKLPLLHLDPKQIVDSNLRSAFENCNSLDCPTVRHALQQTYLNAEKKSVQSELSKTEVACYLVKGFSQLQGHLFSTRLDGESLEKVFLHRQRAQDYLTDCRNPSAGIENRRGVLQLDLIVNTGRELPDNTAPAAVVWRRSRHHREETYWEKNGFAFWNSFKHYLAAAWKTNSRIDHGNEFLSRLDLEESLFLVPNGCGSVTPPSCDQAYVGAQRLRDFAGPPIPTDASRMVPLGAEFDMLKNPRPSVNTDILNLSRFETASGWVGKFQDHLSYHRSLARAKLLSARNRLRLALQKYSGTQISKALSDVRSRPMDAILAKNMNLFCSEYIVGLHDMLGHFKTDMAQLPDAAAKNQEILDGVSAEEILFQYQTLMKINEVAQPLCIQLSQTEQMKSVVTKEGEFQNWFREFVYEKKEIADDHNSALNFDNFDRFCEDEIICGRQILAAMIDLRASMQYKDSLLFGAHGLISPALFNPYAERLACQTYDPGFMKRAAFKVFAASAVSVLASTWAKVPVYLSVAVQEGHVTSFRRLVEDGKVLLNAQVTKEKLLASVSLDFGSLTGVPCAVSYGEVAVSPSDLYVFEGISLNYQTGQRQSEVVANSGSDILVGEDVGRFFGMSCSLHFSAVSKEVFAASNAATLTQVNGLLGIARSVMSFFRMMNDPDNIPKTESVNINRVADTFAVNENPSRYCQQRLKKGKSCLNTRCEDRIVREVEDSTGADVLYFVYRNNTAIVETSACTGQFQIAVDNKGCATGRRFLRNASRTGQCEQLNLN
jgi:hypothetical protein